MRAPIAFLACLVVVLAGAAGRELHRRHPLDLRLEDQVVPHHRGDPVEERRAARGGATW